MLKFALIGCGRIAKQHSELLGRRRQIADADTVGRVVFAARGTWARK